MRIASKTRRAALVAAAVLLPLAAAAPVRAQTAPSDGERAWVQRLQSAFTRGELENAALETGAADAVDPIVALARRRGVEEPEWLKTLIAAQGDAPTLAALGDSISDGMASCAEPYFLCPWNSWSIGDEPTSVRSELAAQSGRRVGGLLVAVPGAAASLLPAQALAVYLASAFGLDVRRMTLLIGHDDSGVCLAPSAGETERFRSDVALALSLLERVAKRRGAKLLISSVSEIPTLLRYGGLRVDGAAKTCRRLWKDGGHCPNVLDAPGPERLAQVRAQIDAFDDVLSGLSRGRGWILYEDVFNAATRGAIEDPAERLSPYDCFHPSAAGQAVLGRRAWDGAASFFALPDARPAPKLGSALKARLAAGARGDDWADGPGV